MPGVAASLIRAACAVVLLSSCGAPKGTAAAGTCTPRFLGTDGGESDASNPLAGVPSVFLAFSADFCGYHAWKHYDVTSDAKLAGIHDGSTVTEYINALPRGGSTAFPVGTIIVKEATGGTIAHELFAMVKRGGGFNVGAPGWEWFDLKNDGEGVDIVWHGFGPPAGDTYGGDAKAGCNTCHTACNNDAVCAKPFALKNF